MEPRDNVVQLRSQRKLPHPASPVRDDVQSRQRRPLTLGDVAKLSRRTDAEKIDLTAPAAWADLSIPAMLARARLRRSLASARATARITDQIVARARRRDQLSNPFSLPEFPPRARPPVGSQMAMDDTGQWATQSWTSGLAAVSLGTIGAGLAFPGYAVLAELAQRPEYRRFAEVFATEMTRKWISLKSTGDDPKEQRIQELGDYLDNLGVKDVVRRCLELDELFGRSHLYVDTGDTDDRDELRTSIGDGRDETSRTKIQRGKLKALRAVEPVWCYPTQYDSNDPLRGDWYEPTTWFVMGKEVHRTRLLKFVGREVPDLLKPTYSFGGLSMTQMSMPYVDNWIRTRQSVADLIHAFSVFVLKTDLGAALQDGGEELFKRMDLFNILRDNRGLMMISKETEDFANVTAPLGGLEGLQAQTQEHMAAVSAIPTVKLLGVQPTGLNATDEGGIRMFYDWIAASQEKRVRRHLTTVIDLAQLSLWGEVDDEITFGFEPLWSLDEKGQAEVREIDARTSVSYVDAGVLSTTEVREHVASDPDSPYSSIDVEEEPDLRSEEEEGLDPRAGGKIPGLRPPHPQGEGEGGEESEDEELEGSPFEQRVRARSDRHARREGDFYDRANARAERNRSYLDPNYLSRKVAGDEKLEEENSSQEIER